MGPAGRYGLCSPVAIARIDKMESVSVYERHAALGGVPVLVRQTDEASGKAMFRSFNESSETVYSDIELVDAAAVKVRPETDD